MGLLRGRRAVLISNMLPRNTGRGNYIAVSELLHCFLVRFRFLGSFVRPRRKKESTIIMLVFEIKSPFSCYSLTNTTKES